MTITEKELAEKLRAEAGDGYTTSNGKWQGVARRAAELLGVELAPEKPEPGTWWINEENGDQYLCADEDDTTGQEAWCFQQGSGRPIPAFKVPWHKLTPARVVPAEPPVLTNEGELAIIQEVRSEGGPLTAEWTARRAMRKALARHGGARELPGRDEMRDAIDDRVRWLGPQYAGEVADAVMDLLGGGDDE